MQMSCTAVITTINSPTKALKEVSKKLPLIVIGDEKTPKDWKCDGVDYYNGSIGLSYVLPKNHYARKNLGYLKAMMDGADCIYDTDDDNIPNNNWNARERECKAMSAENKGWVNIYSSFTKYTIWPRGLPLTEIDKRPRLSDPVQISSPIHQGLADGSPDVDAIWRLTRGGDINFEYQRSIHLPPGTWSPFNSQSTWWFKEAFPLMYLPQYCSMRMTDIIRSFVAQRCLWEMGKGVVFHSPSDVIQERNKHDLMKDFEDEVQGYLYNDKIKQSLDELNLHKNMFMSIKECYMKLCEIGVVSFDELTSLSQWLLDVDKILYRNNGIASTNMATP